MLLSRLPWMLILLTAAALVLPSVLLDAAEQDRSPVDLVLLQDGALLATANQTSHTVSLVRTRDGQVLDEASVGQHPQSILLHPDGKRLFVSAGHAGRIDVLEVVGDRLVPQASLPAVGEPHGMAITTDGKLLYVALTALDQVLEIDLATGKERRRIDVGRWPRHLAITPDGKRMAVTASGDRGMAIVDLVEGELAWLDRFVALNLGHVVMSNDGKFAYYPWMVYRANAITAGNIRLGWVLASRIARSRLDKQERREAISLDPRGEAIADPHGIALTSDEDRIVCSASGSQELLVYQLPGLPFESVGGPDHIDPALQADKDRFFRIPLPGRPLGLRIAPDNNLVYVANYLRNSVQQIDLQRREVTAEFDLGGPPTPSLARQGEAIFYDGKRSLDQWYSCHSCHYEGGGNAVAMDTLNDGSSRTFKTVLPLYNVTRTAPWTWHGWQTDLDDALHRSLTTTMLGPEPQNNDLAALRAYFETLTPPPNPLALQDSAEVTAGRDLFFGAKAACSTCHSGDLYTDGKNHDVGLGSSGDRYKTFNTPSLLGVFRKSALLHDGRARSLEQVLEGPHAPENVRGEVLSEDERHALIEFLKTL
ncbi:cytochrome c peroxidase [Lignipirellula cremea]|uniref:Virginiamycin B lyase n=1 Tax=Lignipirellula cremea TaxID=2528010 RepID=A0A518DWA6_9BACT|nr:cytochrome c peroxidase [Lignipirellula cremea]QDU96122.1 Virginiamycin B lyase [Lignipirellula cremea]